MAAEILRVLDLSDPAVWAVTAADGEQRGALIATFVSSASIVPQFPRVLIGLARQHRTWELVEASEAFALHLLGREEIDWVWRFGMTSSREGDKFTGLRVRAGETGSPILLDAPAWLECRVEARFDTGDRTLFLAAVIDGRVEREVPPLRGSQLRGLGTPEQLQTLRRQLVDDAQIDAAAIEQWRTKAKNPPLPSRERGQG